MSHSLRVAAAGAVALAAVSFFAAPASALPVPAPLATVTSDPGATVEPVRLFRRGFRYRRGFYHRPFVYRRPFYRRGLPGHPIRRILRHL